MKIHHLRNATFVIESNQKIILIDPMLGDKESLAPFARIKHQAKKNPLVSLPDNANSILGKVTNCLLTHSQKFGMKYFEHSDHLDSAGKLFLQNKKIGITTLQSDISYLKKYNLNIDLSLVYKETKDYLGGSITAIPAIHGHGWIHYLMANGAGFFLELPNEPSIYISGDTVYTKDVEWVLNKLKPDIAVMAAGNASLDFGKDILMNKNELLRFVQNAPGKVIANHMEALNHCPLTRSYLRRELKDANLLSKVYIPEDGEVLNLSNKQFFD